MAQLVLDIIDNDPEAQVIPFHDSRMGIERIVQKINRPEEVLPYRSGYLAVDRRKIEARLRDNSIRGIIATSAMELGIDITGELSLHRGTKAEARCLAADNLQSAPPEDLRKLRNL